MIRAAVRCVAIVLAGAAPAVPQGRAFDGNTATVGPIRPAYRCEPACPGRVLSAPELPSGRALDARPIRSFGVEHYPAPVTVPEPGALALFGAAVAALAMVRRRKP